MKINKLLCVILMIAGTVSAKSDKSVVYDLLERVLDNHELPVKIKINKSKETFFEYKVTDGILHLTGSDNVAICRGFYDYAQKNKCGVFTWSGSSLNLPDNLEDIPSHKVVSPVKDHFYFNVCTYGYSMPYWDWERWEKEIDWMALHGVNTPLALVGYEAIISRVWKKMGLTEDEINSYFTGPAHLPWLRMGNICGIDGPLNEDWHKSQIELQHKILDRMRALDMKPICPGFPGFIPESFKRVFPELNIIRTSWGGAFHNWMISPQDPMFSKISIEFIKEWEKEFGKSEYYLVDSFNEMDIPFPDHGTKERYELVASYGEKVYNSIRKANPKATWVMQGWMFGYQRDIWDYKTLGALVSKVPDDKMLLLDLAVDYNKNFWNSEVNWEFYKGFYNKKWVYSVIPNMGGKTGLTGILDFYANGHIEALNSKNRGNLIAIGAAPEGIENNEILYELIMDAGWRNTEIDVDKWISDYVQNRYGKYSSKMNEAWKLLHRSIYNYFTDHPRYNWQFRPGTVQKGSIKIDSDFLKGIELFLEASHDLKNVELYKIDLAEMMTHYLGAKSEILIHMIDQEYLLGDTLNAHFLQSRLETLMLGMDALLSTHPYLRLDRWTDFAVNSSSNDQQKIQYRTNAKRIVTIWGPPVDDYSARMWSGLIRTYYLPRWKHYYESRDKGTEFNFAE